MYWYMDERRLKLCHTLSSIRANGDGLIFPIKCRRVWVGGLIDCAPRFLMAIESEIMLPPPTALRNFFPGPRWLSYNVSSIHPSIHYVQWIINNWPLYGLGGERPKRAFKILRGTVIHHDGGINWAVAVERDDESLMLSLSRPFL